MLRRTFGAVIIGVMVMAMSSAIAPASGQEEPVGIGVRLVDAPVDSRDDSRARVYIVDHLAPGAMIERRIEISNTTPDTQAIDLYAAAATIEDGSFVGESDDTPNELSSWVAVDPGSSRVVAGDALTATVTIRVPSDAAPGEQYAVVWAETRSGPTSGSGVVQVSRVGIRLYISVGPGGAPAADFTIDSLTAMRSPDGQPMIAASVHNTGGRALDIDGTLRLSDGPGGLSAGPFDAETSSTLGVDDTQPVTIELDESLPDGPWHARVTLASGLTERRADAVLTFPEAGSAEPVAISPAAGSPWWRIAAGIIGLLLLAGLAVWFLRRRQRGRDEATANRVTPSLG